MHYLQPCCVYCQLSGASDAHRHCSRVVPQVSTLCQSCCCANGTLRCTAYLDNLNVHTHPHRPAYVDGLVDSLDSWTLWVEFGIDNNIIVCHLIAIPIYLSLIVPFSAIHSWHSTWQHLWNDFTGSAVPSNQGNIQGPPHNMDMWVSCDPTWRASCRCHLGWHRLAVCTPYSSYNP